MVAEDTYYDYAPIPEADLRGKYCAAPRHGATHVQAHWLEKYASVELGVEPTESLSCNDCHDSMLQAFLDDCLPEITEEEREQAIVDGIAFG